MNKIKDFLKKVWNLSFQSKSEVVEVAIEKVDFIAQIEAPSIYTIEPVIDKSTPIKKSPVKKATSIKAPVKKATPIKVPVKKIATIKAPVKNSAPIKATIKKNTNNKKTK